MSGGMDGLGEEREEKNTRKSSLLSKNEYDFFK